MSWPAADYDEFQKVHQLRYGLELLAELEAVTELAGKRLLDMGCGNGTLTLKLAEQVGSTGHIVAIDRDDGMLQAFRAKKGHERVELQQGDIIAWLHDTARQFDIIFSNAVIHWLGSYDQLAALLAHSYRCLSDGGYLAIRFSLRDNALASKQFLQEQLRRYTNRSDFNLEQSIFAFDRCLDSLRQHNFQIKVARELRYAPFDEKELSFRWLLSSQPLLNYLEATELDHFGHWLWQEWSAEKVEVNSHHALFIACRG